MMLFFSQQNEITVHDSPCRQNLKIDWKFSETLVARAARSMSLRNIKQKKTSIAQMNKNKLASNPQI